LTDRDQRASRIAVRKRESVAVVGGVVIGAATNSVSLDLSWCGAGKHFVDRGTYLIDKFLFGSRCFRVSGKKLQV